MTHPWTYRITLLVLLAGFASGHSSLASVEPELTVVLTRAEAVDQSIQVRARFTNHTKEPLRVIRPQDGSYVGWLSPKYEFKVKGPDGELGVGGRCGNHGARYNADNMITLAPGRSAELDLTPPYFDLTPGRYQVTLTYSVAPDDYPGPTYEQPTMTPVRRGPWPDGIFVGSVSTSTVELRVP